MKGCKCGHPVCLADNGTSCVTEQMLSAEEWHDSLPYLRYKVKVLKEDLHFVKTQREAYFDELMTVKKTIDQMNAAEKAFFESDEQKKANIIEQIIEELRITSEGRTRKEMVQMGLISGFDDSLGSTDAKIEFSRELLKMLDE
jgi:hypothetical protein